MSPTITMRFQKITIQSNNHVPLTKLEYYLWIITLALLLHFVHNCQKPNSAFHFSLFRLTSQKSLQCFSGTNSRDTCCCNCGCSWNATSRYTRYWELGRCRSLLATKQQDQQTIKLEIYNTLSLLIQISQSPNLKHCNQGQAVS